MLNFGWRNKLRIRYDILFNGMITNLLYSLFAEYML